MFEAYCSLCGTQGTEVVQFPRSVTSEARELPCASALFACTGCGHAFTRLDLDLPGYYATQYDAALTDEGRDELVVTADGATEFRTDVDYAIFRRLLGPRLHAGSRVFEYGSGHGRILSRLKKDGLTHLEAYDVSERYRTGLARIVGDGRVTIGARPTPSEVDVACTFFVLEHDEDPRGALRYLRARLAPSGLLYVVVPTYTSNLGDLACADHVQHFSPSVLCALLESSGLSVLTVDATSAVGSVAVLAEVGDSREARVEARRASLLEAQRGGEEVARYFEALLGAVRGVPAHREVYVYGAGFYGALAVAALRACGRTAAGLFDANPRKQGESRLGLIVAPPESAKAATHGDAVLLVAVNPRLSDDVRERLAPAFHTALSPTPSSLPPEEHAA